MQIAVLYNREGLPFIVHEKDFSSAPAVAFYSPESRRLDIVLEDGNEVMLATGLHDTLDKMILPVTSIPLFPARDGQVGQGIEIPLIRKDETWA